MVSRKRHNRPDIQAEVEAAIGYHFVNSALLVEALRHSSTVTKAPQQRGSQATDRSNERLEFLGDRVLGLVVAHLLIEAYPDEAEGGLSHRHSVLVRRDTLAAVATEIGLERWLDVAHGGRGSGGMRNPTIIADACEAIIGAVFLDGGYEPAAALVDRFWRGRVADMTESPRDSKTMLQVLALSRGLDLPCYRVLDSAGPAHAPIFTIEVRIDGLGRAQAEAGSKRAAEQAAAAALLDKLEPVDNG